MQHAHHPGVSGPSQTADHSKPMVLIYLGRFEDLCRQGLSTGDRAAPFRPSPLNLLSGGSSYHGRQ